MAIITRALCKSGSVNTAVVMDVEASSRWLVVGGYRGQWTTEDDSRSVGSIGMLVTPEWFVRQTNSWIQFCNLGSNLLTVNEFMCNVEHMYSMSL